MKFLTGLAALIMIGMVMPAVALTGGAASRDITPPAGGSMYGFADRGANVSTGIHGPLHARALVLQSANNHVVILSLDLGGISSESMETIRTTVKEKTGLENLVFAVSHSHSAGSFQKNFPSEAAPWAGDVETKLIDAIQEAMANLAPVKIGVGWGNLEEGHNRRLIHDNGEVEMLWSNRDRIPTSPVDHAVGVIRIEREDATPLATLVNFTCHPVILGPDNLSISADFPGAMARRVQESIGGQCMFLQGACGDINPFGDKTPVSEGGFEEMERMGYALADEVLRVSKEINTAKTDADITFNRETVSLAPRRARKVVRMIEAEISTITIGDDIALATFPGEFFVEHGLTLKEKSKFAHTFFVGYANGSLGYFPTINACVEGGYGADFGTSVEPGAGEHLVNRALINLYLQTGNLR